ncbi:MAG: OmpH family outer membrane protein [Nitrospirota bacterium]
MRKVLVLVLFMVLSVLSESVSAEVKIAFLDAQKALEGAKDGMRLRGSLDEYVQSRQKIIDIDEQDIKKMKDELDKQAPVLSQDALRHKQGEFEAKVNNYRKKVSELQKEVQEKRLDALEEFNKKLEHAVKQISEREGYGLVLNKSAEGGAVIYGKESFDITVKVIEQMNKVVSSGDDGKK